MTAADEADLLRLQDDWMQAWIHRDVEALERIIGPDFTLTSATSDDLVGRQQWIEAATGGVQGKTFAYSDVVVRVYGDAAVIKSRATQSATIHGIDWSGDFLLTDVWVRLDGNWQVVARHSSRPVGVAAAGQMGASDRGES
jgi:ketosteroid isomerase-like protein